MLLVVARILICDIRTITNALRHNAYLENEVLQSTVKEREFGMTAKKIMLGLMALPLIVGCATDRQQTQAEGAAIGCGVGALIGNLIGKDREATAIGCAAVGMAGAAYGTHVADQKAQYASREAHFQAVILNAKKVSSESEAYNKQLSAQIAGTRQEILKINNMSGNVAAKNQKLSEQKQMVAQIISKTEQNLSIVKNEIVVQKAFLANNQHHVNSSMVKVSQQEISQLEIENRALERALSELKMIDNRRAY